MLPCTSHFVTIQLCIHLLLFLILVCLARCTPARQTYAFQDERQERYIRSLNSYDFTIPTRVTINGDHISHSLHPPVRRKRREAGKEEFSQTFENSVFNSEDTVHYKVNVDNKNILIKVQPNYKLYLPSLVIERRKNVFKNVSDSVFSHTDGDHHCHFVGGVKGDATSSVALEVCNGLTGLLQTKDGVYFIEPIRGHRVSHDGSHPHVVYKRSALPSSVNQHTQNTPKKSQCGVQENLERRAEKERERWEKHSHRSHRQERIVHHRKKRSISVEKHIEAMVVVDPEMMKYYRNEDITTYVLTIMNMVATLFHDASIGNALNLVVVRMVLLEEDQDDLVLTHHADKSLRSFCKWQKRLNFKEDEHPNHHDVAILLTRINICSRMNEPCSTLGLAQISGICQPHRSCNINEDTGLPLAYTVAHELGHNFGMKHDGLHNDCDMKEGDKFLYVMTSQLLAVNVPMKWSACSRRDITKFIDRGWAYCLDDEPIEYKHRKFKYPVIPPGTMYDADHQCRLVYGPEAELCDGIQEGICNTLWCRYKNKCTTKLESAAEGTICGQNQWCFNGECVEIGERPLAINGNWGEWSSWSDCTRTCGAGVSTVERHCDNPQPSNGGKYCIGERKRYKICNTSPCPNEDSEPSFRRMQCNEFNVVPYKKKLYKWEPVPVRGSPCQLHCKPQNRFFSVMLKDMVTDGTPCTPGTRNMCISGRCRHVGCDWQIDSSAKEDKCGVCHGDGSTCETIKDQFNETQGVGYVEATVIPKDARNIHIEEVADANNYIAVCNSRGEYLLNGHWFIQWSGDYDMAGTIAHYEREGNKETVEAKGPLKEPLHIMLLLQTHNPGVSFEYTVPKENITDLRQPEFNWRYMDWTHCTSSCGGGTQRSGVICEEIEAGAVDDIYCNSSIRPNDKQRMCNMHLCPAKWWTGSWQHCSVSCGSGGVHRRTVICVRSLGQDEQIALEDKACEGQEKPIEVEPCHHKKPCLAKSRWVIGEWTKCNSNPCKIRERAVTCEDPAIGCDQSQKPETEQACSNITCGNWETDDWSTCTRSCDGGVRIRKVFCVNSHICDADKEPADRISCNTHACPVTTTIPTTTTTIPTTTRAPTTTTTTSKPTTTTPKPTTTTTTTSTATTTRARTPAREPTDTSDSTRAPAPRKLIPIRRLPIPSELDELPTVSSEEGSDDIAEDNIEGPNSENYHKTINIKLSAQDNVQPTPSNADEYNVDFKIETTNLLQEGGNKADIKLGNVAKDNENVPMISVKEGGIEEEESHQQGFYNTNTKSTGNAEVNRSRSEQTDTKAKLNPYHVNIKEERPEIPTTNKRNDVISKNTQVPETEKNHNARHRHRHHHTSRRHHGDKAKLSMPKLSNFGSGRIVLNSESKVPPLPNINPALQPPLRTSLQSRIQSPKYKWITSDWFECSRLCGGGIQTRSVSCVDLKTEEAVPNQQCDIISKPNAIDSCNVHPCVKWETTPWTTCSTSCGKGIKRREVTCPYMSICDTDKKPADTEECELPACLAWMHGQWSRCSATCGGGEQERLVQCVNLTSQMSTSGCPEHTKPQHKQRCNTDVCPENKYALNRQRCIQDLMNHQICRALRNMKQCGKLYVRVKCCRTCNVDRWRRHRPHRRVTR